MQSKSNKAKTKSTFGILKRVPHEFGGRKFDDGFIKEELDRDLETPCVVQRFIMKRDGRTTPLTTVKVDFVSESNLKFALQNGVVIEHVHYQVEEYIEKPRVIQCFNCFKFGHPSHLCTRRQSCRNCSKEHSHLDCTTPPHRYFCSNCNGCHTATSQVCPIYKETLEHKIYNHSLQNE